ncbi:MAG: hypothetical protein J6J33_00830, partial [Clostridia bacterium]|nr:hypothetical protein [Clostridia bacterium]
GTIDSVRRSDSEWGDSLYHQNWQIHQSFIYRYWEEDIYCYAVYEAKIYNLHFYNVVENTVGKANIADTYYNIGNYSIAFNSVILLHNIYNADGVNTNNSVMIADYAENLESNVLFTALTCTGYTFRGYYISTNSTTTTDITSIIAPAGKIVPSVTTYTMSADYNKFEVNGSDKYYYYQNWTVDDKKYHNMGEEIPAEGIEPYFYYRDYLNTDLYIYAYFSAAEEDSGSDKATLNFYNVDNNQVGHANTLGSYTVNETTEVSFNDLIALNFDSTTNRISFNVENEERFWMYVNTGYTFLGWQVSYAPLTTNISSVTGEWLNKYTNLEEGIYEGSDILTDDEMYYQDWSVDYTTNDNNTFYFRYTNNIYIYAVYAVNTYNIQFYNVDNNQVGHTNTIGSYTVNESFNIDFNQTFTTVFDATTHKLTVKIAGTDKFWFYDNTGYTFKGWYISSSPVTSNLTAFTNETLNKYVVQNRTSFNITDSTIGDTMYVQNWAVDNEFYFRYTNDIYIYAFYEVDTYNVKFYNIDNNQVGHVNTVASATVEESFNITFNTTVKTETSSNKFSIKFGGTEQFWFYDYTGYNFLGWYVSYTKLTSGALSAVTNQVLNSYVVENRTSYNITDSTIGNTKYTQNWALGNEFYFRYDANIYVYAIYSVETYNIQFFNVDNNQVGHTNTIGSYTVNESFDINFNQTFKTVYDSAAQKLTVQIAGANKFWFYNNTGYTFKGWYVSSTPVTSNLTAFTNETLNKYVVENRTSHNISDSNIGNNKYVQNWAVNNEFYFRYTNNIYIYAFYEVNPYKINYYWTDNNSVFLNSTKPAGVGTLPRPEGTEFANDVTAYTNYSTANKSEVVNVNYNQLVRPKTVQLNGYTFNGWLISTSPLAAGTTITTLTNEYIDKYVVQNRVSYNISDSNIGDTTYIQNWTVNTPADSYCAVDFYYRYDS